MTIFDIERTLFFSDVPDGALKHKPISHTGAFDLTGAISNLGKDIHNALFFDDLVSVTEHKETSYDPYKEKRDPKKAFTPLEELKEDEPDLVPDMVDEEPHEMECRGKTIPPPSLIRLKRINERLALARRQAELLEVAQRRES